MDIKQALIDEHSKEQAYRIKEYIGKDKKKFAVLMKLFFEKNISISQRSAWVVWFCVNQNPDLIKPYIKKMLEALSDKDYHDAVRRNTVRIFQDYDLPEKHLGLAANQCFALLQNPQSPIAIKCFSMSVLLNICRKEPDLKNELQLSIEEVLLHSQSKGVKSRGTRVLKALERIG